MNSLRSFRLFLAMVFFCVAMAWFIFGPLSNPVAKLDLSAQIIPSAIASTIGVTLFWIIVSFCFGRIYCSTVCPLGTLQDLAVFLRKRTRGKRAPFRFKRAAGWRYNPLFLYLICLLLSVSAVCALFEPWLLLNNAVSLLNHRLPVEGWQSLAAYASIGAAVSAVAVLAIIVAAFFCGRDFCNTVCPIGNALGLFNERTLFHIEINPDRCTSCLKCEDACPSSCIKVVSRYVDNSRCVRCFDCLSVCRDDAIRFQPNRNRRPATPLLRKKKKA